MKYSFIVIISDKDEKIDKCLNSILCQSYINYEVLVINNVINYNISKLENKYHNDYNNIYFYNIPSLSISYCRNFGIKNAKGKYVIFVNANDTINNKNTLRYINDYLDLNDVDILKGRIRYTGNYYDERFSEILFDNVSGLEALYRLCDENKIFATSFSYVFNREFLIDNKLYFIDNTYHEDYGLIPKVIYKSRSISSIDLVIYNYNSKRSDSVNIEKMNDFMLHTYNLISYFNNNVKDNKNIIDYFNRRLNIKLNKLSEDDIDRINTLLLTECNNIIKNKKNSISFKIDEILSNYNFNDFAIEYSISLKVIVNAAKRMFKSNLLSVTIGGSAGKNKVIPDWSDLDVYFVLKEYDFKNIELFDKLISKFNIHIGMTYYSIKEVNAMFLDAKTKVMIYEKNNYRVNPTLFGNDYFKKVDYTDIRVNDINNLPIVLHEIRRMHITALNNKNDINNKYLKKLVVLIKCFLSSRFIFTYGYKNVIDEFLKIVNKKRPISNRVYFDIEGIIKNYEIKKEDVLEFGKITISFIENNLKEEC